MHSARPARLALVLALFVSIAPVAAFAESTSDHTDDPATVTLAGSFQSELGCPGDWQPECLTTGLTEGADGVWRGTFAVPAGSWEYKAAIDGTWDENYGRGGVLNGPNIAFTLAEAATVKFYYSHGSHWITDTRNSVIAAAPGSYQSEIGCPGDWQPECLRSWLQDLDGDGTYSFATTAIPPGDHEFKVALNEGWDVNYGAGGVLNGPNLPFTVTSGDRVTFTWNSTTFVPTVAVEDGGIEPGDAELVRPPVRHPFQDEVLYFMMPDRFDDGNPANNCGAYTGPCVPGDTQANVLTHGYLPTDRGYFHGGDIAGLHRKLDYLDDMGVTSIWVAPIFRNKPVQSDSGNLYGHSSGYHGYWILDFLSVDPHVGTNAEFKALVDDAHSRGIEVLMDIVTNHTADVVQLEGNAGYRNKTTYPYLDTADQPFDDSDYAYSGQPDYEFPPVDDTSFPYRPFVPAGEETAKTPAWLNDPLLYHNRGDSTFAGESSLYGDFFGLDDLWTERKEVVEGMIDIYSYWIEEFGVDGFRIDTTKHVNMEFWQKFGPDILAAADAEGIADFFAFGEVYDQQYGPRFLSEFSTRGKLQSTIDFAFQIAARRFASQGDGTAQLADFYAADDWYTDADSNASAMPTFLGNHDMGRIGHFLQRVDQPGATDAELVARSRLAHALMFFGRGQPVIYYGDEQGFTGDGGDKLARQDMFANHVPEYADDDLIGTDRTTSDDNFDPTHPLYQAFSRYADAYSAHPALRRGAQITRTSSDAPGIFAFSRIDRDEKIEYVVALNNAGTTQSATVPTFHGEGVTFDLVIAEGAAPATVTTGAGGALAFDVPGFGFAVYKASQVIPAPAAAPDIEITTLTDGETVTLGVDDMDGHDVVERIEVGADLDDARYAEVTFAASVDGGAYAPIGTDDNPPFRVFYDTGAVPAGARVSFKAIVDDLHGNLASDKVVDVLPVIEEDEPPTGGDLPYAVVHYLRPAGDYGDHTTGNSADFWGLHLWGDIDETIEWTTPKPFLGEDEYGRFAWIRLLPGADQVGFIVHRGDVKDTDPDRFFDPGATPEIWLKQGDTTIYTTQADAQGYATVHYHRDDGDYTGWGLHLWGDGIDPTEATTWENPKVPTGSSSYGPYWNVRILDSTKPLNFIIHKGDEKDPGPDQSFVPAEDAAVWIQSGDATIYPQRGAAEEVATLHYRRPAGDYGDYTSTNFQDFWGLHTWDAAADPGWTTPRKPVRSDVFGQVFEVPLTDDSVPMGYILHRGEEKDPGPNLFLDFAEWGYEVWQLQGADPEHPYILPINAGPSDLERQQAHWVAEDTIVWPAATDTAATYRLHASPDGSLVLTADGVGGGTSVTLTRDGTFPDGVDGFLHLAGLPVLRIAEADLAAVPAMLKGQVAVSAAAGGVRVDATGLQIPGVLDDLYATDADLGVTWAGAAPTFTLWAPTAVDVDLLRFADPDPATVPTSHDMTWDGAMGTWRMTGDASWKGGYYLYEVDVYVPATGAVETNLVTDPYSLSLSTNSARTQIVDLGDAALAPAGWSTLQKPPLAAPEDISVYELHVRDFSVDDTTLPAAQRGTYKAFTADSPGTAHLGALADAGLSHVHLLPVFDIATIEEDKTQWQAPDPAVLATYPPDSPQQQAAVTATATLDGFNWGYDPWHYTVPEGSYSTNPDGTTRIVEFREMVSALDGMGLRVVMDVVYNHTNSAGQAATSVLDRIVPGYYHRLDGDGVVTNSTCCANTATEHAMMEKLMVDSVVTWARDYKVDAFRFDLMGHHSKANMLAVRDALDELTVADDGVDGSKIYLYGEGWNFGEVANDARFVQATQLNMGGTGIGTFNDRIRDAVRGGGPFDAGLNLVRNQGWANGGWYDPNEVVVAEGIPVDQQRAELLLSADQIRVGLAGNLADYELVDRTGATVTGSQVDYNGSPTGYTDDPQEHISYVSAHDNQTLFDISQYHHPKALTMADRVRAQNVAMDVTALSQGVPFFHAGVDMLRSKSFDRDSYNSGDWFNALDFTYQTNKFGVGLPMADKNQPDWPLMAPLLADPAKKPAPADVAATAAHLREILAVRMSSPLFRLPTADEVAARVDFHNTGPGQVPGVVVMSISDTVGDDLDENADGMWAVLNPTDNPVAFPVAALVGEDLILHPVQAASVDPVVRTATFAPATGTMSVPARTTAVFIDQEPDIAAPDVTAALIQVSPNTTGRRTFEVAYACSDDRDPAPSIEATINGAPVVDGQHVVLVPSGQNQWAFRDGVLHVWGQVFTLAVTCTDASGNEATTTAVWFAHRPGGPD